MPKIFTDENRDEIRLKLLNKGFNMMILVKLGQRSCNLRTTFPKYTDSVLELFGQGTLSQRDKLTS